MFSEDQKDLNEGLEAEGQLDSLPSPPAAFRGKEVTTGGDEFQGGGEAS